MLFSMSCPWASMKIGGCKFGGSKTGAVLCPKRAGTVVSQLVPKPKESVPPRAIVPGTPQVKHAEERLAMGWHMVRPSCGRVS